MDDETKIYDQMAAAADTAEHDRLAGILASVQAELTRRGKLS